MLFFLALSHLLIVNPYSWYGFNFFLAALKHPRTPTNSSMDYPSGDSDHVAKRTRPLGIADEVF